MRRPGPATHQAMDTLAEHMAQGCPSIAEAARRMGVSQSYADQLWRRILGKLGEQAR